MATRYFITFHHPQLHLLSDNSWPLVLFPVVNLHSQGLQSGHLFILSSMLLLHLFYYLTLQHYINDCIYIVVSFLKYNGPLFEESGPTELM